MKMDEKYLEEIRNQEKILQELSATSKMDDELVVEQPKAVPENVPEPIVKPPSGQSTLFGGEQ